MGTAFSKSQRNLSTTAADQQLLALAALNAKDVSLFTDALRRGANPNVKDKDGTPLLIQLCNMSLSYVLALLKYPKTDVNATDANGNTALMVAAAKGKTEIVIALLEKRGINIHPINLQGKTALELAEPYQNCNAFITTAELQPVAQLPAELWCYIATFSDCKSLAALRLVATFLAVTLKEAFQERLCLPQIVMEECTFFYLLARRLYGWGRNDRGQLGLGHGDKVTTPQRVTLPENEVPAEIATDGFSTVCCTEKGQVYVWGYNGEGELGLGHNLDVNTPQRLILPENEVATRVSMGSQGGVFCVTKNGLLYVWGKNMSGHLGLGGCHKVDRPQRVLPLENKIVLRVVSRNNATIYLTRGAQLYTNGAWWYDCASSTPQRLMLPENKKATHFFTNGMLVFFLTQSGWSYAMGSNRYGQLGLGHDDVVVAPQRLTLPENKVATRFDADGFRTVCCTKNGEVYVWGYNGESEFGHPLTVSTPQRMTLPESEVAVQVILKNDSTFCLTKNGKLYAWGRNDLNQLGLGHTQKVNTPQRVPLPEHEIVTRIFTNGFGTICYTKWDQLYCGVRCQPERDHWQKSTPQPLTFFNDHIEKIKLSFNSPTTQITSRLMRVQLFQEYASPATKSEVSADSFRGPGPT